MIKTALLLLTGLIAFLLTGYMKSLGMLKENIASLITTLIICVVIIAIIVDAIRWLFKPSKK